MKHTYFYSPECHCFYAAFMAFLGGLLDLTSNFPEDDMTEEERGYERAALYYDVGIWMATFAVADKDRMVAPLRGDKGLRFKMGLSLEDIAFFDMVSRMELDRLARIRADEGEEARLVACNHLVTLHEESLGLWREYELKTE